MGFFHLIYEDQPDYFAVEEKQRQKDRFTQAKEIKRKQIPYAGDLACSKKKTNGVQ